MLRRLLTLAVLLSLACRRGVADRAPAARGGRPGPSVTTFIASDERAVLVVSAPPTAEARPALAFASEAGTLLLAGSAAVPPPAAVVAGPSEDALREVALSLTSDGRAAVPPLGGLPFYDVELRVLPESGKLSAHVALDYMNPTAAPLSELSLRIFANARGPVVVLSQLESAGSKVSLRQGPDPTLATVTLEPPLLPGARVHLGYHVAATVPGAQADASASLAAALLSEPSRAPDYGLFSRFTGGIALADWLPMVAARFEGAYDVAGVGPVGDTAFAEVSCFRAAVELPGGYRLAGPGAVLGEEVLPDRFVRTRLVLAAGRDLTLFASKRYRVADGREGETRVRVVYEEGHGGEGQAVLSAARHALVALSAELSPYPWTTFTAVEVPLGGGAGGAEFSSLVAIAGMFFTPKAQVGLGFELAGPFLRELREFTVTHEVAHQWWAIQVGSHPRLEPDVDEPLAQATAALLLAPAGGPRDRKALIDREVAINYQAMRLLGGEDGPVARPTADFESVQVYAGLVYGKAPLFYTELASEFGDEAVWRALRAYALAHRFGLARRGEVLTAFAEQQLLPRARLDARYAHWFEEAHGDVDLAGRGDPMAAAGELFGGNAPGDTLGNASGNESGNESGDGPDPAALLKAARQALTQAAQGKGAPQAGEQPLIDAKQAQQLLQQLNQTMGGFDAVGNETAP